MRLINKQIKETVYTVELSEKELGTFLVSLGSQSFYGLTNTYNAFYFNKIKIVDDKSEHHILFEKLTDILM